MGVGLSPLPLAAYAAPPASPRGSGPLLRRAAGVPRLRLASPPSGFRSCSSVRFAVASPALTHYAMGLFAPAGLTFWPVRGTLVFLGPFRSLRGATARAVSTVRRKPPPEKSGGGFFMLWAPPSRAGNETLCRAPAALLSLDTSSSDSANATKPLSFCCVNPLENSVGCVCVKSPPSCDKTDAKVTVLPRLFLLFTCLLRVHRQHALHFGFSRPSASRSPW